METRQRFRLESPLGPLGITTSDSALTAIDFSPLSAVFERTLPQNYLEIEIAECLNRYFDGVPETFASIPLDISGGTAFQQAVWQALRQIPYGKTLTYRELGEAVGKSGASRAVGQANRRNPIPIIIPCHRVIQSGGGLGGYQGTEGLSTKIFLLELEAQCAIKSNWRLPMASGTRA